VLIGRQAQALGQDGFHGAAFVACMGA
jgi:hypothetical protein